MNDKQVEYEEYYKAIEDSSKAITLDPDDAAAFFKRGVAYLAIGRTDLALKDWSTAIELNPNNVAALMSRGHLYAHLADCEQALQDLHLVIELEGNHELG